jgi:hypothetical protein
VRLPLPEPFRIFSGWVSRFDVAVKRSQEMKTEYPISNKEFSIFRACLASILSFYYKE